MKSLLLMRHSYAVSDNAAYADKERPLTEHGRAVALQTSELLHEFKIDRIICSSAARTTETAGIIASSIGVVPEAVDSLYLARSTDYRDAVIGRAADTDSTVLVVGHNPGIASLIMSWADKSLSVVPCTVARFELKIQRWTAISGLNPVLSEFISDGKRQTLC